jgi:Flp pilus assembly protein TadD
LLVGDAGRAIPHFEFIAHRNPDDTHAFTQLARACQRMGDFDAAHRWAERALELAPADDGIRFLLAELAYHRGLSDESLTILRELAARRPDDADVQYLLGFVLGDLGHH